MLATSLARRWSHTARQLRSVMVVVLLASCGASAAQDAASTAALGTLPAVAATPGLGDDAVLHPLNLLLIGAPSVSHLEIAAAPFVERCMDAAGFVVEVDAPALPPSTVGERAAAARSGALPPNDFFVTDALSDAYVSLGDSSEQRQTEFARALDGDESSPGCAEVGRREAASPLLLGPTEMVEYGEVAMGEILGPEVAEAEKQFAICADQAGVEVRDSGDLADAIASAAADGAAARASELFAVSDACARATIDIAEMNAFVAVVDVLERDGVLSPQAATEAIDVAAGT